ncbi:putative glutamine amidotransferase [Methylohalomonas lacus]|uniref:Glutamine amidotransferase n=1 Tax=Methylohalomonas lacus TaxID=398773 RepID=A0AAE3HKX5_9GAMM|nr:gamma-glutamyl-gamma-aminobutyrate hydrolase family protein [Methylohalomonas lacus]MCS3904236.1 putative glutamine amidotransferase [Methylohalomonas lacus]
MRSSVTSRHRPLIVVSGPERGGQLAWLFTWLAVRRAGGRARRVTAALPDRPEEFDGLIIGGGADVDPELYDEALGWPHPQRERSFLNWLLAAAVYPLLFLARWLFSTKRYSGIDQARDTLEYELLARAIEGNRPVLGICRGAQLLNVYLRGSLHQNISGFYTESAPSWSILPCKTIDIDTDSRLHAVLQTSRCRVNALHNQSIKTLGKALRVSARETNGIIQAIETNRGSYVIGVQWHPEYLPHHARQQRLFRELVRASDQYQGETQ